jgi:hypothetical protein
MVHGAVERREVERMPLRRSNLHWYLAWASMGMYGNMCVRDPPCTDM